MKKRYLFLTFLLLASCGKVNTLKGYDYTEEKFNTNIFYKNVGQVIGADPLVLREGNTFYLYTTTSNDNADCSYIQVYQSENLTDWTNKGICYQPELQMWTMDGLWAPEVIKKGDTYYLYYAGWSLKRGTHLLGVATSKSPLGPFIDYEGDSANGPITKDKAPFDFGFPTIDPSPFIDDDGQAYLCFTKDQVSKTSTNYIAKLNDDMVSIDETTITELSHPDQDFEKLNSASHWNEAPFIKKIKDKYYYFYSANYYMDRKYCVGYGVSDNPMGPYVKSTEPLLITLDEWDFVSGTGHCSIFDSPDGKELFIAYHTHLDPNMGGAKRQIVFDRLIEKDGKLHVNGPSLAPQLLPSGIGEYKNLADLASFSVNEEKIEGLNDGFINFNANTLENEIEFEEKEITLKITLPEAKSLKAIMVYDSASYEYKVDKIDELTIGDKKAFNIQTNKENLIIDEDYEYKIPMSSLIYEFEDVTASEITLKLSSKEGFNLNEIVVIGK